MRKIQIHILNCTGQYEVNVFLRLTAQSGSHHFVASDGSVITLISKSYKKSKEKNLNMRVMRNEKLPTCKFVIKFE